MISMALVSGIGLMEKLGDGNSKHEWKDDYREDAIKVSIWILEILGSKQ